MKSVRDAKKKRTVARSGFGSRLAWEKGTVTQKNDKNSYSGIFFPSVCNTYNNIGPNMPCVICNLRYARL